MNLLGFYKETVRLHEDYQKQVGRFMKLVTGFGKQLRVRGEGRRVASDEEGEDRYYGWYYSSKQSMSIDGRPGRAIMDTIPLKSQQTGESRQIRRNRRDQVDEELSQDSIEDVATLTVEDFFKKVDLTTLPKDSHTLADVPDKHIFKAPLNPTIRVFHLEKHGYYSVHAVNATYYKYKPELINNLILDPDILEVTKLLCVGLDIEDPDFIENKSQSTIITCIGNPGLGKTLLAEVMSELVGKPLFQIQAAQLGSDPVALEENLKKMLARAERWDAILLIDEANAYIHDRGVDIAQNAIVGVFLRLLEYYRGTLILTTNQTRPDGQAIDVDDAILQRSSAVVNFEILPPKLLMQLWKVHLKQLGLTLPQADLDKAVENTKLSGRTIRQVLRSAKRLSISRKVELSYSLLEVAAKFVAITKGEVGFAKKKL